MVQPQSAPFRQPSLFDPTNRERQDEDLSDHLQTTLKLRSAPRDTIVKRPLEETLNSSSHLLTVSELSQVLSIAEKTIYGYVSRGLIPYVKIQSNIRFRPRTIAKWLATREFEPRRRVRIREVRE